MTTSRSVSHLLKYLFSGLAAGCVFSSAAHAATFTVTTTADDATNPNSLRGAITAANANPDFDTINFAISGSGVQTIHLTNNLPALTQPVTIDGYSQPGSVKNTNTSGALNSRPLIEIEGSGISGGSTGLTVQASDVTLRGLVINRFINSGISVRNRNFILSGCYIGTGADGTTLFPGLQGTGVDMSGASDSSIGSIFPEDRNLISGNRLTGLAASGGSAVIVHGNLIGTDKSGTLDRGNGQAGVRFDNMPQSMIGGGATGEPNIISGNVSGVSLFSSFVTVQGNYIGVDASGLNALPNDQAGIFLQGGSGNLFGGDQPGQGNIISGNGGVGIDMNGNSIDTNGGHFIYGNVVGASILSGGSRRAIPNGDDGIALHNSGGSNHVGGTIEQGNLIVCNAGDGISISTQTGNEIQGNTIGLLELPTTQDPGGNGGYGISLNSVSSQSIVANQIEGNGLDGIGIGYFRSGTGNLISQNGFFQNGDLPIDLGLDGVTANDSGDADTGANELQNFPVITSVTSVSGSVRVAGTINSVSGHNYRIEVFASPSADASGHGEGRQFVGSATVANGATWTVNISGGDITQVYSATATDTATNDTSEMSDNFSVTSPFVVTNTNDTGTGSLRAAITAANSTAGDNVITFNIPGGGPHIIAPGTDLPILTDAGTTIDGTSQPGWSANTSFIHLNTVLQIVIDGSDLGASGTGLGIVAARSTVKGLSIINCSNTGIQFSGAGAQNCSVQGCWLGVAPDGSGHGNSTGLRLDNQCSNNIIGGNTNAAVNLISGNLSNGVSISADATANIVGGNFIGTVAGGDSALPNGGHGIGVYASGNLIGVSSNTFGNVLSGNGINGVAIDSSVSTAANNNSVLGNKIGTSSDGSFGVGNGSPGIALSRNVSGNRVGNTGSANSNLIGANGNGGIAVFLSANNNIIQNNEIGQDTNTLLTNQGPGINVTSDSNNNQILGNRISVSKTNGINLVGGTGNVIQGNSIFENGALGIDLENDGVDTVDDTTGANNRLKYPVINSITGTSSMSVNLTVSAPVGSYTVEFFRNLAPDDSGFGEGAFPLNKVSINKTTAADQTFTVTATGGVSGDYLSATLTGTSGTSEFARDFRIGDTLPADLSVTQTAVPAQATIGNPVTYTITVHNGGPSAAAGVVLTDQIPTDSTFVSSSPAPSSQSGSTLTYNLGNLANGADARVVVRVKPTATGTATNQASVSGAGSDPVSSNNTSNFSVGVHGVFGAELVVNGDAELATGASDASTQFPIPGWTVTGSATAVKYGTPNFPTTTDPGSPTRGINFFAGGPGGDSSISQSVDVSAGASAIDSGDVVAALSGYLGGFSSQADNTTFTATFRNGSGVTLDSAVIGPVTPAERSNASGMLLRNTNVPVPTGTRTILLTANMTRLEGSYNDGYADDLSLVLSNGNTDASVVTSAQDTANPNDGVTSLREAITFANSHPDTTITFALPGNGSRLIQLKSALPIITGNGTIINGFSQPGASASTPNDSTRLIQVMGGGLPGGTDIFVTSATGVELRGLVIANGPRHGVRVTGGTVFLNNDFIASNGGDGVRVVASGAAALKTGSVRLPQTIAGTVQSTSIINKNGGLGINYRTGSDPKEVTSNDSPDSDGVPNFPIITSAVFTRDSNGIGHTLVKGTLTAQPSTRYTVTTYFNQQADPSGFGEGSVMLGQVSFTTRGNGTANWTINGLFVGGGFVSALTTMTPATGTPVTGEFSRSLAFDAGAVLAVSGIPTALKEGGPEATIRVLRPTADPTPLTVVPRAFTTDALPTDQIEFPATVIIPAGARATTFQIRAKDDTVVDGEIPVIFGADAPGLTGTGGIIRVQDNDVARLTISPAGPIPVTEGGSTVDISISRNTSTAADLKVTLSADLNNQLTFPTTVTIPAGQTQITVPVGAVDDTIVDGDPRVVLTANATRHASANRGFNVLDNDKFLLQLTLPTQGSESDHSTLHGTIRRTGGTQGDLRISLSVDTSSQLNLPSSVTIPDGQSQVDIPFTVVDDTRHETSPLSVLVTARSAGLTPATATIQILDDDPAGTNLLAWGYNEFGQVGNNNRTNQATPVLVGLTNVVSMSANGSHSLALLADGSVRSWGYNGGGQLGDGTQTDRARPVTVVGLTNVRAVAAGWYHSLALKSDGTVWAWGFNKFGQVGDGSTIRRLQPVQVRGLTNVTAIAAGVYFSMALKSDGTVWVWGNNEYGQLGDNRKGTNSLAPKQVPFFRSGVAGISAGGGHALYRLSDGSVYAAGWNQYGQLGDGSTMDRATPVRVQNLSNAQSISAGYVHSLALVSGGSVIGWGNNSYGQLGTGGTADSNVRSTFNLGAVASGISAGANFSAIQMAGGAIRVSGGNNFGQLGNGGIGGQALTPQRVFSIVGGSGVSSGYGHLLAIGDLNLSGVGAGKTSAQRF